MPVQFGVLTLYYTACYSWYNLWCLLLVLLWDLLLVLLVVMDSGLIAVFQKPYTLSPRVPNPKTLLAMPAGVLLLVVLVLLVHTGEDTLDRPGGPHTLHPWLSGRAQIKVRLVRTDLYLYDSMTLSWVLPALLPHPRRLMLCPLPF